MVITRQMRIYVMHRDPVVTRTVTDFLGDLEYEAVPLRATEDLEASLEAESRQAATAVVAQLEALGADPVGRLRRIQARQPHMAFVLMDDDGFPAGEAFACGVCAVLRQPLRLTELERVLAGLCERYCGSERRRGGLASGDHVPMVGERRPTRAESEPIGGPALATRSCPTLR